MNIPWLTRNVACASMLAGTATLVAGNLLALVNEPADGSFAAMLAMVSGGPGLWLLAATLAIAGPLLWLPGLIAAGALPGAARAARSLPAGELPDRSLPAENPAAANRGPQRGRTLAGLGSLLLAAGMAVGVGHFALFFGVLGSAADSGLPAGTIEQLVTAEDGYVLGTVLLWVFLAGLTLGTLLLCVGLRMARAVPVWVPVAALAFAVTNFMGGPVATVVGAAALLATFVPMGLALRAVARNAADPEATTQPAPGNQVADSVPGE